MKDIKGYEKDLREWLILRNYSVATIGAYGSALRQFLEWPTNRRGSGSMIYELAH